MTFLLINRGYANGEPSEWDGCYLARYDIDAMPLPVMLWTKRLSGAVRFANSNDVFRCWQQVRAVDPVRIDGKPNRPLTAFNIEIVEVRYGTGDRQQPA